MRTEKQLFKLALKNQQHFQTGLCSWFFELYLYGLIDTGEYVLLRDYLNDNRPKKPSTQSYWFLVRDIEPRIKWLNEQIKKL